MIFNSANILHIDDERSVLKSTEMILEPKNYSIMGVTNANEGIELLKKNYFDYDLIFLDLEMPEMDGIETFIAIRKINPKIPILFVSAHFGEAKWERKLRNLEIEIKRIDKPFPIVTSKDFLDIENTLYVERNRYREELLKPFK
ncbi:MAG: response regulator, partial [Candidatus Thorarchaeota archaeon]